MITVSTIIVTYDDNANAWRVEVWYVGKQVMSLVADNQDELRLYMAQSSQLLEELVINGRRKLEIKNPPQP